MNNLSVLDMLNGTVGNVDLARVVLAAVVSFLALLAVLGTVIRLRGQGPDLIVKCGRDLLIACGFFLTVFFAPAGLYFMGRAFWRAGCGVATGGQP